VAAAPRPLARPAAPIAEAPPSSPPPSRGALLTGSVSRSRARVMDVDFRDEVDIARVVISIAGDPEYTVLRTAASTGVDGERSTVLRIQGTELPSRLVRTLDTSAYHGPVSAVSTYADPDDPGAVRVVVRLATAVDPAVYREGARIVLDFPKAMARATVTGSYQPPRVAGYGLSSIPLQMAPALPQSGGPGRTVGGPRHRFSGARIDLDFKDADIHNILRLLADVGQVNIVTSDDVKGTVTIRMRDTPWDQALDVILRTKGLGQVREGNLIRVAPQAVLEKEQEAEVARQKVAVELKPLSTRLVPLSYANAEKIMPRVQDLLSPRGKVSVDERTNMLIVSDISGNLALAEDLIRNLDTQTPQVLIEARIVEAQSTFLRDLGVQWGGNAIASAATGNPTGIAFPNTIGVAGGNQDQLTKGDGLLNGQAASPNYVVNLPATTGTGLGGVLGMTFGSVAGNYNVNLRISAAETQGNLRILSAPKITTLDNVQATIEQGTAIPISTVSAAGTNTVFIDANLKLTVKPHITNEGSIIMYLEIMKNEPDFSHTSGRGDPTILKKQAKTEMLVRDGDTAVIGGIYTRNSGTNYSKVPWLGDIPVLGWLFKQRRENDNRTELLIFITPRLVNRPASIAASK
jgi:type IV pilus assembly protein PilQ